MFVHCEIWASSGKKTSFLGTLLESRDRHVKKLGTTGYSLSTGCLVVSWAVIIMVPRTHISISSVDWCQREIGKRRKWVLGIRKTKRAHFLRIGTSFSGLFYLFVTSIWMMKLERKTRNVQAA